MRKFSFLISLAVLVLVLSGSAAFSQSMDDVKAQLKAQVRREMGLSDTPTKAPSRTDARQPARQKNTFDLDIRNIDIETALQWVIIMMFMGFIPATIAHFKGHNFFLWWLLGVAFFIVALPVIIFLKKREKRPPRKKEKAAEPEKAAEVKEEDAPGPSETRKEPKPAAKKPEKASALDIYDQIEKLSELKARGVITQEEFREKKRELLDRI